LLISVDNKIIKTAAQNQPARRRPGLATEFLALKEEISRKSELEERLRHAQKMEAIGQLAGSVAHDFNNVLMSIIMGLGLLRAKPGLSSEINDYIREIESEAALGATLARQLLNFGRRNAPRWESLDVNQLLDNLLLMLHRLLGENIEISFQRSSEHLWVNADPGSIEQVVLNLCLNARDAMPEGGRLTLSATLTEMDPQSSGEDVRSVKQFVCLSVCDTGCGMDETVLGRLFEPFFTTKEIGKGTGLGLATACGIVRSHRGWIEVDSVVGRGSSFQIFLPLAAPPLNRASSPPAENVSGGGETILLVEDNRSVRRSVAAWLRNLGYVVLEAGNGAEALEVWERRDAEIQLLFTDMMMPGEMTGLDLAVRLKRAQPSLKIISSSGYGTIHIDSALLPADEIVCLPKPYETDALASTVRGCLDRKPPRPHGRL
jgi:signal transduction histidine kinase/CheY-like chemotaxis protein